MSRKTKKEKKNCDLQFQFRTKARQGRESESLRDIWSGRGRRSSNVDNRQRRGRKIGDLWLGVGLHLNQYGYGLDTCVTHSRYGEYPADMGEGKMKNEILTFEQKQRQRTRVD